MRHVFLTHEIFDVWVKQTQHEGRNKQGNVFFEGDIIYSYGHHFPLARLIGNFALYNDRRYSKTTDGHQACVRGVLEGRWMFKVVSLLDPIDHQANLHNYQKNINDCFEKAKKARQRKQQYITSGHAWINEGNSYIQHFKLNQSHFIVPTLPASKPKPEFAEIAEITDLPETSFLQAAIDNIKQTASQRGG